MFLSLCLPLSLHPHFELYLDSTLSALFLLAMETEKFLAQFFKASYIL